MRVFTNETGGGGYHFWILFHTFSWFTFWFWLFFGWLTLGFSIINNYQSIPSSHPLSLTKSVDHHWLPFIAIDYHWLPLTTTDCHHWLPLTTIDCDWLPLTTIDAIDAIDYHWLPLTTIDAIDPLQFYFCRAKILKFRYPGVMESRLRLVGRFVSFRKYKRPTTTKPNVIGHCKIL